ncbi:MAG: arsenate reductase/protein-tyrosine-phosphatase family protein [Promethearchaeota archaeon]
MKTIKNVLWVCFGNTSRSPLALGLSYWLQNTMYKEELKDINFDSAGFINFFKTAQPETITYLKTKSIDFSDFHGKIMDEKLLDEQDLILVMEIYHLKRLRRKFKQVKDIDKKSFLLLEFAGESGELDITDPVNFGPEVYKRTIELVEKGVIKSIEKIIELNKK